MYGIINKKKNTRISLII